MRYPIKVLVEHRANINYTGGREEHSALTLACQGGHRAAVKVLIKRKAVLDLGSANGLTPLHLASIRPKHHAAAARIVRLLLRQRASPQLVTGDHGVAPLTMACRAGNQAAVLALMEAGAQVNHRALDGSCAITDAASLGHSDCVRTLAAHRADLSVRSVAGRTLTDVLLSSTGDRKFANWIQVARDFNAVHWACERQDVDALKELLGWVGR